MQVLIIGHPADLSFDVAKSLAELGADWQVSVAIDASEALQLARTETLDVVVCGMNPIGMTGIGLLTLIRARVPQAVRLMLLDDDEAEQAGKALAVAHRLMHKPLRAEELLEAVESITDLREILDAPALKSVIGRIENLPSPPLGVMRDQETATLRMSVAQRIADDPISAAKALRTSNSAYFASGRTTTDVRSAVIRLGPDELQRMVLAAEVFHDGSNPDVDYAALRQRALLAAELAATMVSSASAEMAATAALLAEVGMLLPGVQLPDRDGNLVGDGPHYAEAGAYLLGLWGLPMPIVEAVANHHQPRRSRARGFWISGAVHVAHALAANQPVDMDFLASVGVADRLPDWRRLAGTLAARIQADTAGPTPIPVDSSAGITAPLVRPADYLLRKQAIVELECAGVRYTMLGGVMLSPSSAEAVEYLLKSRPYDSVAVDLTTARLHARTVSTDVTAPSLLQLMQSSLDAVRLGRHALALLRLRLFEHSGMDPAAFSNEAVEGARQRKLPLWSIDRDLDVTLQRALQPLWPIRRLQMLWRLAAISRTLPPVDRRSLQLGDLVASACFELGVERAQLNRTCFSERHRHMARSLAEQSAHSTTRRVLVVVGRGHLDGLVEAMQANGSAPGTP